MIEVLTTRESPVELPVESIRGALDVAIPPRKTALLYKLSLLLVSLAMLVLPLSYVALAAGVAWGVVWYATHAPELLGKVGTHGFTTYVGPLIVGAVLFVFMLKPLFARRAKQAQPLSIGRDSQQRLYAFVDGLAGIVGAPRPRRIDLDLQVNASASFRRGMMSLFSRDLVLTIGIPLLSGLSLREFASVVAHELGHFSQGAGMRGYYLISSVNRWFARVVYERDRLDLWLERAAPKWGGSFSIVMYVARLFVWLTRRILQGLMMLGVFLSSLLSRQMEFDADSCAIRVAGSDAFTSSMLRLPVLEIALEGAFADVNAGFSEARLSDDIARLVEARLAQIPTDVRAKIAEEALAGNVGMYASHPATRARIAAARELNATGALSIDAHASALIDDWDAVCREVTRSLYRNTLGDAFDERRLVASESVATVGRERERAQTAFMDFLRGMWLPPFQFLLELEDLPSVAYPEEARERLTTARRRTLEWDDRAPALFARLAELDGRVDSLAAGHRIASAGVKVDRKSFGLEKGASFSDEVESARRELALAREQLGPYGDVVRRRILDGLALRREPDVRTRLVDADAVDERLRAALRCCRDLTRAKAPIDGMQRHLFTLFHVLQMGQAREKDEGVRTAVSAQAEDLRAALRALRDSLADAPYPFEHADRTMTLGRFALEAPPPEDLGALLGAGQSAHDGLIGLYVRSLGEVTAACLECENALGLEPLPVRAG